MLFIEPPVFQTTKFDIKSLISNSQFVLCNKCRLYNLHCIPQLYFSRITLTSQWTRWRLKSPASRLFTQPFIQTQIKENIKASRHWPLCGEFTGDRWIPRTNGQWRGKCFHLMTSSWANDKICITLPPRNILHQVARGSHAKELSRCCHNKDMICYEIYIWGSKQGPVSI